MAHFPIKICGLSMPDTMAAALDAGADMVGLVFHPRSPRYVRLEQAAELAAQAEGHALVVALLVDPDDAMVTLVRDAVRPRLLQLHGCETPDRVREIRALAEMPVMKAVGVSEVADLAAISAYRGAADMILLDAKPPRDAAYPGGHGRAFDWDVLRAMPGDQPFMLSGGLTHETVGDAIRTITSFGVRLAGVDVSTGVESAPGIKDVAKIKHFVEEARSAHSLSPPAGRGLG